VFDGGSEPALARGATELAWRHPLEVFAGLGDYDSVTLLFSGGAAGSRSRWSYLCLDPIRRLRAENGQTFRDGTPIPGDVFSAVQICLAQGVSGSGPAPFSGGAAGFFGYEMAGALERVPRAPGIFPGVPDANIGIYDLLFAWDHSAQRAWLIAGPQVTPARFQAALTRWRQPAPNPPPVPGLHWRHTVPRDTHLHHVKTTLDYIRAGDIYQANITAPFTARRPAGSSAAAYFLRLAQANPAPFSAYVDCGQDCAVASVSPERFIALTAAGAIETRPIKGTAPRGATPAADAQAAQTLLHSEKDRAENLMIVDLMRNDLSRVASLGSVRVPSLAALETFPSVHHLVSAITAQLRPGQTAIDLLRAAFPGGSVTGAPKIRAMHIIAALEAAARGPYCGIAAWLGFDGAMDSSILIRTVTVAADRVIAQAGGGIVADSDPGAEWEELMIKVMPILKALGR
jgi:para-aminobenzoate synthetase component 1